MDETVAEFLDEAYLWAWRPSPLGGQGSVGHARAVALASELVAQGVDDTSVVALASVYGDAKGIDVAPLMQTAIAALEKGTPPDELVRAIRAMRALSRYLLAGEVPPRYYVSWGLFDIFDVQDQRSPAVVWELFSLSDAYDNQEWGSDPGPLSREDIDAMVIAYAERLLAADTEFVLAMPEEKSSWWSRLFGRQAWN